MKKWTADVRYVNTYHAQASNEEEYCQLARDLFAFHKSKRVFGCDEWDIEEHLFDEDYFSWHDFFDTPYIDDVAYEEEDLPNPQEYNGEIREKPKKEEYPVVLTFENINYDKILLWYSYEQN